MKTTLRNAVVVLFAGAAVIPACANPVDVESSAPSIESESLALTTRLPERIAGTYRNHGVALRFAASSVDAVSRVAIASADGAEVFTLEQSTVGVTMSVLGRYRHQIDAATMSSIRAGMNQAAGVSPQISFEGDPTVLNELEKAPEFAELPWLSRALGAQGITGREYPGSLGLHLFAKRAAHVGHVEVPSSAGEPAAPEASRKAQGFLPGTPLPTCTTNTAGLVCCRIGTGPTTCTRPAPQPSCLYPAPDLRCDPNHDKCFGMCGNDCDCWDWVCGDCNYHWQCAQHDWICQQGETLPWWDPTKYVMVASCYSWDAVAASLTCFPQAAY